MKRIHQNLYRAWTDFCALNDKQIRINHWFPPVWDCIEVIDHIDCKVMSVVHLRDAYPTLRLALHSQKYCGIIPFYGLPTYCYLKLVISLNVWKLLD